MRSWQKILQDEIFRPDVVFAMDDSGLTVKDYNRVGWGKAGHLG